MIETLGIAKFFASITPKGWLVAAVVAILIAGVSAAVLIADNAVEDTLNTAKDAGANEAVVEGHNATLDQIGAANEGRNEITGGRSAADYEQCLRDSAPGYESGCDSYKPIKSMSD